jgi:hypothetical protein
MNKSRFGPFALEGRLGEDDSGSVLRAVHVSQSRLVAVKLFDAPLAAKNPSAKQALVDEIETLKGLKHWNIVKCYGGILEQMQGCIASELVEGESLKSILNRRGRLTWESVVDYANQIASGLECAHEQGVVHQDLHPDKILVAEDGTLKIADFRSNRSQNPWCASSRVVTVERAAYRAPEQLRGESELTHKVDLYALGCMMYEMLIGEPPFTGESAEIITEQQQNDTAPRVDSIIFECPIWLSSLVGQLLEKDPIKRPYGASAVILALNEMTKQVAAKTSVMEHAAGGFSALQPQVHKKEARELLSQARRESRRGKQTAEGPPFYERAWFLALCLLLLISGIGGWLLWPASEEGLLRKAVAIIENKEGLQRESARPYLEQLLQKFPNGEFVAEAEEHIKELDMASAERKFSFNVKHGREPKSESERVYKEAWDFEQFGDRITALEKYRSLVDVLSGDEADVTQLAFVNLARRQINAIESEGSDDDRLKFVASRLDDADKLAERGKQIDAKKIWRGIIELYGNKPEFESLVQRAENCLHPKRDSSDEASETSA